MAVDSIFWGHTVIDTLGFYVVIDDATYSYLVNHSIVTQRIDKSTGSVEFEYDNFHLNYSYNYKVIFRLDSKSWQYDFLSRVPVFADSLPYLRFEFSAPKILWGHNLYSCTFSDAIYSAMLVRDAFNSMFNVEIPHVRDWYCYRLDTCANFVFDCIEQVKCYIRYLQRFDYPRRIKNLYEDTGIYFASRLYTLKIYCKGVEFKKHDSQRFTNEIERKRLQNFANRILRIEVENKGKLKSIVRELEMKSKMFSTFQRCMRIYDLLYNFDFVNEINRIMKKFLSGMETKAMRILDVYNVLRSVLSVKSANFYYSIYVIIVTQGQNEAKRQFPRSTYYRALQLFRDLKIPLVSYDSDNLTTENCFPADFSLEMSENNKYYQLPTPAPESPKLPKVCIA